MTPSPGSEDWSFESLKAYFDARLDADEAANNRRFEVASASLDRFQTLDREALAKAEEALNRRLEMMNEFRAQILSERSEFTRKTELSALDSKFSDRLNTVEHGQSAATGQRSALAAASGIVVSVLALAIGVMWRGQINHTDVSQQISSEVPSIVSLAFEDRIRKLELNQQGIQVQIAQINALDRFFCKTRAPTLPTC